jgi:hypothetical protein
MPRPALTLALVPSSIKGRSRPRQGPAAADRYRRGEGNTTGALCSASAQELSNPNACGDNTTDDKHKPKPPAADDNNDDTNRGKRETHDNEPGARLLARKESLSI